MKKLLLALTATAGFVAFSPGAQAQYFSRPARDREVIVERGRDRSYDEGYDRRNREVIVERGPKRNLNDGYDRAYNERRRKTVYVIDHGRPVRREVFFDGNGRYYQMIDNRPVFIRERVFESYPERYYYRDGRPRPGISLNIGG